MPTQSTPEQHMALALLWFGAGENQTAAIALASVVAQMRLTHFMAEHEIARASRRPA
jgi:hypothetical protein